MTESLHTGMSPAWAELALSLMYRLSAYAVVNLVDDAAMLSIVFI